jgi:hypothetical protein
VGERRHAEDDAALVHGTIDGPPRAKIVVEIECTLTRTRTEANIIMAVPVAA